MTRRGFLAIASALTATASSVLLVADRVRPASLVDHLRRLEGFGRLPLARLREHYAWLPVNPSTFEQYVTAYEHHFGRLSRFSIPHGDFYTRFLLCTDFFPTRAADPDNQTPVQYTGFYFPLESPCNNPLAQPPPSDAELAAAQPRPRSEG
jgi:hypothetical protein